MTNRVKIRLQGHEKFSLREGWIYKGLSIIDNNPYIFKEKNCCDEFGIGNNMVKSIRYWLKAYGLIEEKQAQGVLLSERGKIIKKYDPYIEDLFTVWILHSYIAKNIEYATTWFMFFNRCDIEEIEKDKIESILNREIKKYVLDLKFSEKSVKNDLDVILNMYSKSKETNDPEDKRESPFAQLQLIKNTEGIFSKKQPEYRKVSKWNILYELAQVFEKKDSISLEEMIDSENGLKKIYQISNIVANELFDELDNMGYIHVDRTAGLDMIYKTRDITVSKVMIEYYTSRG